MVLDIIMVDKRPSSKQRLSFEFQPQVGKYSSPTYGQQNGSSPGAVPSTPRRQPPEYRHQEAIIPQRSKATAALPSNNSRHGTVISRIRKRREANSSTPDSRHSHTLSSSARKVSDISKASTKCSKDTLELPVLTNNTRRVSGTSSQPSLRSSSAAAAASAQVRSTSCPSFAAQDGKERALSRQRKARSLSLEPASTKLKATTGGSQEMYAHEQMPNNTITIVYDPTPQQTEQEFPNIAENVEESTTERDTEGPRHNTIPGQPMHVMSMARRKLHKVAHSDNPAKYHHDWRTGDEKIFENYQELFSAEGRKYLNVSDMEPELAEQVLAQQEPNDKHDSRERCARWLDTLPLYGTAFGVNYRVEAGFEDVESDVHTNNTTGDVDDER